MEYDLFFCAWNTSEPWGMTYFVSSTEMPLARRTTFPLSEALVNMNCCLLYMILRLLYIPTAIKFGLFFSTYFVLCFEFSFFEGGRSGS